MQHRPSYGLTPLSSPACRQLQSATSSIISRSSQALAQKPGCFLKLFFSLPLLLPPRISIYASKVYPFMWHSAKKYPIRIERFLDLDISYVCDQPPGNGSLTSPMKATTISTLGNQSSLTNRRFFSIPIFNNICLKNFSQTGKINANWCKRCRGSSTS